MRHTIAIILTFNEESNIKLCIESIRDLVDAIHVVDSGSTDNTVALARELGALVFSNKYEYYAQQFNWALDNTITQPSWILRIDADERFPEDLKEEIKLSLDDENDKNSAMVGMSINSELTFLGKKLRFGASNKRKVMMFKYPEGRLEDKKRDAHCLFTSGFVKQLSRAYIHDDMKDVTSFLNKYISYSDREAEDYLSYNSLNIKLRSLGDNSIGRTRFLKDRIYYNSPSYLRAFLWFIYNYIFRLGFLDGKAGFVYNFLECFWYRVCVDALIDERLQGYDEKPQ